MLLEGDREIRASLEVSLLERLRPDEEQRWQELNLEVTWRRDQIIVRLFGHVAIHVDTLTRCRFNDGLTRGCADFYMLHTKSFHKIFRMRCWQRVWKGPI